MSNRGGNTIMLSKRSAGMSEEQYIKDIKEKVDQYVQWDITAIQNLAKLNHIEEGYVLELYRDKVTHKINRLLKDM